MIQYFSSGLVQPPTSFFSKQILFRTVPNIIPFTARPPSCFLGLTYQAAKNGRPGPLAGFDAHGKENAGFGGSGGFDSKKTWEIFGEGNVVNDFLGWIISLVLMKLWQVFNVICFSREDDIKPSSGGGFIVFTSSPIQLKKTHPRKFIFYSSPFLLGFGTFSGVFVFAR